MLLQLTGACSEALGGSKQNKYHKHHVPHSNIEKVSNEHKNLNAMKHVSLHILVGIYQLWRQLGRESLVRDEICGELGTTSQSKWLAFSLLFHIPPGILVSLDTFAKEKEKIILMQANDFHLNFRKMSAAFLRDSIHVGRQFGHNDCLNR